MPVQLIKKYKKYSLKDFEEIFKELSAHLENVENLKGKTILELGPGTKLNMLNFLQNETDAVCVWAAGKTVSVKKNVAQGNVADAYLLPFLKKQKAKSVDIIYSRHVFEKNSFHPLLLIKHPAYWNAIKNNTFENPGIDFPSSEENMQAVFRQAWRVLKPGGVIISQIGKRKAGILKERFISQLKPAASEVSRRELGRFSEIVTIVK